MSCQLPSILTLDDGTTRLEVHGMAMLNSSSTQGELETGNGVIEYASGRARRWVRFERGTWVFSGAGPAPSQLWSLLLTVDTWTVEFPDPDNIGATKSVTVVPARPSGYAKDDNTASRSWTLTLQEAQAR